MFHSFTSWHRDIDLKLWPLHSRWGQWIFSIFVMRKPRWRILHSLGDSAPCFFGVEWSGWLVDSRRAFYFFAFFSWFFLGGVVECFGMGDWEINGRITYNYSKTRTFGGIFDVNESWWKLATVSTRLRGRVPLQVTCFSQGLDLPRPDKSGGKILHESLLIAKIEQACW